MPLRASAVVVLLVLVGYGAVKAWPLLSGPELKVTSPAAYTSLPDGYLTISGVAKHTESLIVNDGQVYIDQEGRFSKTLLLSAGGAIITLTATDRFGRKVTERRSVFIP
jgi:hypothetical protein